MTETPRSKLSPPQLHWGRVGPEGDRCDHCGTLIKANGDCFICIRRAFERQGDRLIEIAPLTVLLCVECGWKRPESPTPHPIPAEASEGLDEPFPATDGPSDDATPSYYDAGVME